MASTQRTLVEPLTLQIESFGDNVGMVVADDVEEDILPYTGPGGSRDGGGGGSGSSSGSVDGDGRLVEASASAITRRSALSRQNTSMTSLTNSSKKGSIKRFYREQSETVESFEECERLIQGAGENDDGESSSSFKDACAVNLSLAVNVALLVFKIFAFQQSGSISVFSALVDSALDIFNGIVIYFVSRYMKQRDRYLYPMGKGRFDALATIVIASVMVTFSFEIVRRAIDEIIELRGNATAVAGEVGLDSLSLGLMISTVVLKFGLFLMCRAFAVGSDLSMVSALATDHINDCLTNTVALIGAGLAKNYPDADPVGAIIISVYIMWSWYKEGIENVKNLAGQTASPAMIKQLTYIAMHHDRRVQLVDTVRAIHLGTNVLVEVDVVLPPEMALHEAHDIGESLQHRLELLPEVDRAHVHLDYEIDHGPEDEHKRL